MVDFRVTVSDGKTGKSHKIEVSGFHANNFIGKSIGDVVGGDAVGLSGYSIKITGGTDRSGFPMRPGLKGPARRKILVAGGIGFKSLREGMRRRKSMRGDEISSDIGQINAIIHEYGSKSVDELLGPGEKPEAGKKAEKAK